MNILKFLYALQKKTTAHLDINKNYNRKQFFKKYKIDKSLKKLAGKKVKKWARINLEKNS